MKNNIVYQGEPAECGLACMAMLCGHLGKDVELKELRKLLKPNVYGVSLGDLLELSKKLSVDMSAIKFTPEDIRDIPTPAIIHWVEGHFVILNKANDNCVEIINPAMGIQILSSSKFSTLITGYALIVKGIDANSLCSENKNSTLIKENFNISQRFLLLSLLSSVFVFAVPYFGLSDYNNMLSTGTVSMGLVCAIFVGASFSLVAGFLLGMLAIKLAQDKEYKEYSKLFYGILKNTYDFFDNRHPSDVLNRMQSVISSRVRLAVYYNELIVQVVLSVFSILVLFFVDFITSAVFLFFSIAVSFVSYIEKKKEEELNNIDFEKGEKLGRFLLDSLLIARDLKSMESENGVVTKLKLVINDIQKLERNRFVISYSFSSVKTILSSIGNLIIFIMLFFSLKSDSLSISYAFTFLFIKGIASESISSVLLLFVEAAVFKVSEDRAKDFICFEKDKNLLPKEEFRHINLNEVGVNVFGDSNSNVQENKHNICYGDINIIKGDSVLVIGPSGSGKTTLLKIISGNLLIDKGSLTQGSNKLEKYDLQSYCYFHSNKQMLFDGTLFDNLTLFKSNTSISEVLFWINYFDVEEICDRLPNGLHTNVSESTDPFSSGEKQKLLLIRAFISGKQVLVIDEPTSNLNQHDSETLMEKVVNTNRTIVASSHNECLKKLFSKVVTIK